MPVLPAYHPASRAAFRAVLLLLSLLVGLADLRAQEDDATTTVVDQRPLDLIMLRHGGGDEQAVYDDAAALLLFWRANTSMQITDEPTAFSVDSLRGAMKADDAPRWLLLAGDRAFAPDAELVKVLRAYLEAGGAILADARSAAWERSFRTLMQAIAPDQALRPIPADAAPLLRPAALSPADLAMTGQRALDALVQGTAPATTAPAPASAGDGAGKAAGPTAAAPDSGLLGLRRGERWTIILHTGGLSFAWPAVGDRSPRMEPVRQVRTRSALLALNLAFYWDRRSKVEYEVNSVILKPATGDGGEAAPEPDFSDLPVPF